MSPLRLHRSLRLTQKVIITSVFERSNVLLLFFDISLARDLIDLLIGVGYLAASKSSKQDQIGVNTISHFATVPHSTFDPSITTISPSSLVLVPEPKPVRVILTKRGEIAKKRGRKPKARDESTNLAAKVVPVPGMVFVHG